MKTLLIILLILFTSFELIPKELIRRYSDFAGVRGIKCLDSNECYVAEKNQLKNFGNQRIGY